MAAIADRITWTIDLLDIQPDDHLLEIGCGAGVAATLAAERLRSGSYTGIDRSQKMVDRATTRNQRLVDAGVASFVATPVHEFNPSGRRFSKAFLVNVNLHLHEPSRDFAAIRELLMPDGRLYLVSHPPVGRKAREYGEQVPALLTEAGFESVNVLYRELSSGSAVAVVARARTGKS